MRHLLFWIVAGAGIAQAVIGLSYFISSIWERERRASIFGGLQFLLMLAALILIFALYGIGFFDTSAGVIVLILGLFCGGIGTAFLVAPLGVNSKALEGTKGLIVADVKRQDEREIMFVLSQLNPTNENKHGCSLNVM